MVDAQVQIKNKLGLHARAAVRFVNLANSFRSHVKIVKDGAEIDGKSILSLLALAATQGTVLRLKISGRDEKEALKALKALIDNRFTEAE